MARSRSDFINKKNKMRKISQLIPEPSSDLFWHEAPVLDEPILLSIKTYPPPPKKPNFLS